MLTTLRAKLCPRTMMENTLAKFLSSYSPPRISTNLISCSRQSNFLSGIGFGLERTFWRRVFGACKIPRFFFLIRNEKRRSRRLTPAHSRLCCVCEARGESLYSRPYSGGFMSIVVLVRNRGRTWNLLSSFWEL